MKTSILTVAAAVLALSASAYAAEPVNSGEGYQANIDFISTKTRAEVKAETIAALRNGEVVSGEAYPGSTPATPAASRQQVRAELAQAIKAGTLPRYE
ncbi:DUF4148 domain-containing protein [Pseudoduganella sp. LjRoot289]|uniref:DUF4148 domain-containing protein n=1 Tax=Pseudoduganella sp. LjRoot289 TaxID=3342314 RepID=UPI003ECDC42A